MKNYLTLNIINMKKTILILALAVMSISCSTGDDNNTNETNTDCNCGKVTESSSFNVVNGQGGVSVFSVIKIKNNCTGSVVQIQRNGNIPVGSQICNY
jgi:hypothetical protein